MMIKWYETRNTTATGMWERLVIQGVKQVPSLITANRIRSGGRKLGGCERCIIENTVGNHAAQNKYSRWRTSSNR
jgi:hypothetical protein